MLHRFLDSEAQRSSLCGRLSKWTRQSAAEIDGRHFHGDAHFERDRWQQNAIVLAGWRILRFTWTMLEKYPDRVMDTVHRALAL